MLTSVTIAKRNSAIRQELATLSGKEKPDENELRAMGELETEYGTNEQRYRAALIGEDAERKKAQGALETRDNTGWDSLVSKFEVRQCVQALSEEGRQLNGATAEVVSELRNGGFSYQGIPIPWDALMSPGLETRAGETIAGGVYVPKYIAPAIAPLSSITHC